MIFKDWLSNWLDVYKKPNLKPGSIQRINVSIRNHIPKWLLEKDIQSISVFDCDKALSEITLSRSRKYSYYIIRASLHKAFCLGLISDNVSEKIEIVKHRQHRGKALTKNEQKKFLKAIENDNLKNAFLFLLYSGVRRGELLSLQFSDILYRDKLIRIRGTKTESSERYIVLSSELRKIVSEQKKVVKSKYVFPYNGDWITHRFKELCPGEHKLHDLRHTFITRCAESGINVEACRTLVGHKSLTTTLSIYTHISTEFLKKEIKKFKI